MPEELSWNLTPDNAGFLLVAVAKDATKWLVMKLLPYVYRPVPLHIRRLWQPPSAQPQQKHCVQPPWHTTDSHWRGLGRGSHRPDFCHMRC